MSSPPELSPSQRKPALTWQTRSLWRNRDYLLLWSGQIISEIGSKSSLLAFPLLVLFLTGSPAQAGLLGALRGLPYILFCLPAGALIDRWNRKRVMILCDTGRALAMGSIPLAYVLGHLTLAQLYIVSFTEGTLYIFFSLSETAALPQIVAREQLTTATAQNQAVYALSDLLGPSLGGALYSVGQTIPFLADALSYTFSVGSLFFIKARFQGEHTTAQRKLWGEISEGISWLRHHPLIRFIAFLTGGLNLFTFGTSLLIIVLAQRQHASSFQVGLILAVGGVGALIGATIAPAIRRRLRFGQMLAGVVWASTLLWPLFALAPNLPMLGAVVFLSFVVMPAYDITQFSYRLALIPDHLQGRVNSAFRLIAMGGQPIGLALMGLLLQAVGPVATVWLLFLPQVGLCLATTFNAHVQQAPALPQATKTE